MEKDNISTTKLDLAQSNEMSNDMESPCNKKEIPLWLVLLDNIPTLILFILGAIIVYQVSTIGTVIFVAYSLFSVVFFWARICPYCYHYGTLACPCGYGVISAKLFKKRQDKSFIKVFKKNLVIVFPNWFIPFSIAIYLLITRYTNQTLILTIAFSLIGFVVIPLISKLVGCKNCEIKEDCPWMKAKVQNLNLSIQSGDTILK
ncbi:MAG TPA: hypothetical protein VMV47_08125 [Bacteroidales bacterium]|nr:hypothetical protein [Bacteroidales bacterium]HUX95685.1 hypothetical protein [Bacteroidales bacterium]